MKGSHHMEQFSGVSNLLQETKESVHTTEVQDFSQVDEGDVQWLLLLSTLLLQLA
jgi:hypothetical protein